MNKKKFIRKKENFICENCETRVSGNGYTNHCPKCLWSKHVDINPGDRLSGCGALMEPVGIEISGIGESVLHCCVKCKLGKKNKISIKDDRDVILELSKM